MEKHIIYSTSLDFSAYEDDKEICWCPETHQQAISSAKALFSLLRKVAISMLPVQKIQSIKVETQVVLAKNKNTFSLQLVLISELSDIFLDDLVSEIKKNMRTAVTEATSAIHQLNLLPTPEKVKVTHTENSTMDQIDGTISVASAEAAYIVHLLRRDRNIKHEINLHDADNRKIKIPTVRERKIRLSDPEDVALVSIKINSFPSYLNAHLCNSETGDLDGVGVFIYFTEDHRDELTRAYSAGKVLDVHVYRNYTVNHGQKVLDSYELASINSVSSHEVIQPELC